MTIGSPIDKHLLLWPRLWNRLQPALGDAVLTAGQIQWRNYYDYGDPIGFKLDTARRWLEMHKIKAFQFCGCPDCRHDIGFARYLLPGKAHNDYWEDPVVFEHFIAEAIQPKLDAPRPRDKAMVTWLSPLLPYLFSFLVLLGGVYILYKAVHGFTYPLDEPLDRFLVYSTIGVQMVPALSGGELLRDVLGIAGLIAGSTLFARFPRLAGHRLWKVAACAAFLIGCAAYWLLVSLRSRLEIGAVLERFHPWAPTLGVLVLAFVVASLGYLMTRPGREKYEDRRQRWLFKGMRPLILCGAVAVALVIGSEMYPEAFGGTYNITAQQRAALTDEEFETVKSARLRPRELSQLLARPENLRRLPQVEPLLTKQPPVWPVALAAAGFLYLWWLATLIFDLAFVWHRYVRRSVAGDRLSDWESYGLPSLKEDGEEERCRNTAPERDGAQ